MSCIRFFRFFLSFELLSAIFSSTFKNQKAHYVNENSKIVKTLYLRSETINKRFHGPGMARIDMVAPKSRMFNKNHVKLIMFALDPYENSLDSFLLVF